MRFKKPEGVEEGSSSKGSQSEADAPPIEDLAFCIPAECKHIQGCGWNTERQACFRNNCDALFTPAELREQQKQWSKDPEPQLIIAAGPERSGSTWLFNAVRLLFQHAEKPLDAYWVADLSDKVLNDRYAGLPECHHVLIKTHAWSGAWDGSRASHIFVTHRDLRQVLASYRRMQWEFELPQSYVDDHLKWREHAELDIAFEDVIGNPAAVVQELARRVGLEGQVNLKAVLQDVQNLPVPKDWVDPLTQIWPSHISTPYMEARVQAAKQDDEEHLSDTMEIGMEPGTPTAKARLEREAAQELEQRFSHFFELYGYI